MIDFTKPVQTRDGRKVTILCKNARNSYPIVGLIHDIHDLYDWDCCWDTEGKAKNTGSPCDLINTPEAHEITVYVYKGSKGDLHTSCSPDLEVACNWPLYAKFTKNVKEGEGL